MPLSGAAEFYFLQQQYEPHSQAAKEYCLQERNSYLWNGEISSLHVVVKFPSRREEYLKCGLNAEIDGTARVEVIVSRLL